MRKSVLAHLIMVAAFAGSAFALTPDELTPAEKTKYVAISSNPQAAAGFLATRDYVRKAAAIVSQPQNKKLALELERPKNFDERHLLPGDAKTLSAAVDLSLAALAESLAAECNGPAPAAVAPNTPSLAVSDLSAAELARYELTKADPLLTAGFLATRGYVRKSEAILAQPKDKKLALELQRPKNFDKRFLVAGDVDKLNAAIELNLNALAESLFTCDTPPAA